MAASQPRPSWEVFADCQAILYEWAESFDTKDWNRLSNCVAPTVYLDYRAIMPQGEVWEAIPGQQFVAMVSSEKFLGDATLKTQHFIGGSKWESLSEDEVVSHHQMRVAHQKYTDESLKVVDFKGHAHGNSKIYYRQVEGKWKFAGLVPGVWWTEDDYEKLFLEKIG